MTRFATPLTIIAALLAAATLAQAEDACCPADGQNAAAVMPASNPQQQLPEGHPPLPADAQQLPEGHPPMPGMAGAAQPVAGTLIVKTMQGTPDGPALAGQTVLVRLFDQTGQAVEQRQVPLDATGMAMIDDLTIAAPVQPVVSIDYAGVRYETAGQPMTATNPDQVVRLAVYESADAEPDWSIKMRHVMVRKIEGGLAVTEMIALNNPADRAWAGRVVEHGEGETAHTHDQPVTFALDLPDAAQHVSIGAGFRAADGAHLEDGQLVVTTPMIPGTVQYQLTYMIPAEGDTAALPIVAPAPVGALMVFVPEDGKKVEAEGLTVGDAFTSGNASVRMYSAQQLAAGQPVSLNIEVAPAPMKPGADGPAKAAAPSASGSLSIPQIVAGVGAGALIFGAIALVAVRLKQNKTAPTTTTGAHA